MNAAAPLVLSVSALVFSGCGSLVANKNQSAPANTPPPVALNFVVTQAPVELLVQTVIVPQGPGSWMREAHWDEYVVTVTNRSLKAMRVEGVWLTGAATAGVSAGSDPSAVERASHRVETAGVSVGNQIAKGIVDTLRDPRTYVPNLAAIPIGVGIGAAGAITGGAVVAAGAMPAVAAATALADPKIYADVNARHEITMEFHRRRLALPLVIEPGASAQGSFFFPITRGPRALVFYASLEGEMHEVTLPLGPLGGLHLPPPPPTSTPAPATASPPASP